MDIVIVSQYLRNIEKIEGNNSRFIYIANLLSNNSKNKVEIITSNYMHAPKRHVTKVEQPNNYKITAIDEPGYKKNVCLKRFYSHYALSKNIKRYLEKRIIPDCIYCAIPSLDVAKEVAKYCEKNNVRFIIDIQDLWPEAFKLVLNIPVISDIVFFPMKKEADYVYSQADEIVSVSQTYAERALEVNKVCKKALPVFLGTEMAVFEKNVMINVPDFKKPNDEFWIGYCGTLGHSYDLHILIDALEILEDKDIKNVKAIIMGDGPKATDFKTYAQRKKVNAIFTGRIPYPKMCSQLMQCDVAVNPISHGAAQSIINKHGDYAMAGLPVLSTQESKEYQNLVDYYEMGYNCDNINAYDIAEKIKLLLENESLRKNMSDNARRCAKENFNRSTTYEQIVELVENVNGKV